MLGECLRTKSTTTTYALLIRRMLFKIITLTCHIVVIGFASVADDITQLATVNTLTLTLTLLLWFCEYSFTNKTQYTVHTRKHCTQVEILWLKVWNRMGLKYHSRHLFRVLKAEHVRYQHPYIPPLAWSDAFRSSCKPNANKRSPGDPSFSQPRFRWDTTAKKYPCSVGLNGPQHIVRSCHIPHIPRDISRGIIRQPATTLGKQSWEDRPPTTGLDDDRAKVRNEFVRLVIPTWHLRTKNRNVCNLSLGTLANLIPPLRPLSIPFVSKGGKKSYVGT